MITLILTNKLDMEKCPTKTKDWCEVMQNFTKVANMKNPKL